MLSQTTRAAMMFMHSMIIPHITYCMTIWSQANNTSCKPLLSLYKKTLKVLDRKPINHHHCHVLKKYKLLSFENWIRFTNLCLMYKIQHELAPRVLNQFVNIVPNTHRSTRSATRGDCIVPLRKSAFGQTAFSVRAAREWNLIPIHIRNFKTYASFKFHLKKWLIDNQDCQHYT